MTEIMAYFGVFLLGLVIGGFFTDRPDRDDDGFGGGLLP